MAMVDFSCSRRGSWVCPNDRQLALRAKLQTGWSVKTGSLQSYGGQQEAGINEYEKEMIKKVIKRAEKLEEKEQERVGRLVERLENMKRNALGNGTNQCVLCGESFGMLVSTSLLCHDCKKAVCHKCGIETFSAHKEPIALCKICSETREMWKKSGAWFFKGLPKYVLPEKRKVPDIPGRRPNLDKNTWSSGSSSGKISLEQEDESGSEEETSRKARDQRIEQSASTNSLQNPRPTVTFDPQIDRVSSSLQRLDSSSSTNSIGGHDWSCNIERRTPRGSREIYYSGDSLESESNLSRQVSFSTEEHLENSSYSGHNFVQRTDSIVSEGTREWNDDRISISSSSISGHRTSSSDSSHLEIGKLGSLEFSLMYNSQHMTLECSLLRAKGLKAMDMHGLADPFCRLTLLPNDGKFSVLRSKTVHKTRNPEFNETLIFQGLTEAALSKHILHILILDDDKYGYDFMGEARIPLVRLTPQHPRHMNINLERHYLAEEICVEDSWRRGQILVTLTYSTRKRALLVGIMRCVNLPSMDNNGFSDPFVKLRLKPDPQNRKCKTSIKWRNLNPIFNEEFEFETRMPELTQRALEVTVWDKDYGKSNDYLGGLVLGWHSKGERLKHWLDMIKYPDHKHEGWHNLGEGLPSE